MNDDDNETPPATAAAREVCPQQGPQRQLASGGPAQAPVRAIRIKGDALRAAIHRGGQLDLSDLHERFIDLWPEARLVICRAKHSKSGIKQTDPKTGKQVLTFVSDDRLVLDAINTTKGVLDSLVKLRRDIGPDSSRIPHWAVDRIERALRTHPEALADLLKALADGEEIIQVTRIARRVNDEDSRDGSSWVVTICAPLR